MLHQPSNRELTALRSLMFDTFGKRVYGDQNPHNVSRRFHLTNAKLRDILHVTDPDEPLTDIDLHLCCPKGQPLEPISTRRLWQYLLLCRLARCALQKRGYDPDIFATRETIELAKHLRARGLAGVLEAA